MQRSSLKIFTAHSAYRNADLNLTPVTGTTNGVESFWGKLDLPWLLRLDFVCLLFYLQYLPVQTDAPPTGAANIGGLNSSCLFERAEIQIPVNKYECPQRLSFSPGIYSEAHSPITTPEIIWVIALRLQPIRGCPQHSRETGTRLSSAIHRRLLSRFFLRDGGRLYTG